MPQYTYIDADEYTSWDPEDVSANDYYKGAVALVGGVAVVVPNTSNDNPAFPPGPKFILPPSGTQIDPPRVKRTKVPPPDYS